GKVAGSIARAEKSGNKSVGKLVDNVLGYAFKTSGVGYA
ncbi:MAG: hypothetical protein ACJAQ0_001692, partial [Dasania sp.]